MNNSRKIEEPCSEEELQSLLLAESAANMLHDNNVNANC